ncbi:MAG: glycosyltransferase family 2 protein [Patescibacteria group bacterium]|nr:glycosyltransferase family 2 protein [Patescibacteria group bacterium]MDD5715423.1 glycosyltransferase family 2 protein [Patescibacteria group bacterium]
MNSARVSIIILNWNGLEHLQTCLSSVYLQTYKDFEVLFVDNGSTDGSAAYVREKFSNVQIIETGKNFGFAEGNNVGIRRALEDPGCRYVVCLNNDTEVKENWLSELVSAADADPRIGVCASKLLYFDNRTIVDSAGDFYYRGSLKVGPRGHGKSDTFFKKEECLTACAAAALYRREALEESKLGDDYFDSDHFAYIEDSDLGLRIRLAGWKCMFIPTAVVYHKVSATTSQWRDNRKRFYSGRNRVFSAIKLYPIALWPRALRNPVTYQSTAGTVFERAVMHTRIKLSVLRFLPAMLRKRALVAKLNRLGSSQFREWQENFSIDS